MNRRFSPFAELIACAALLASGYVIVASARATSIPSAVSDHTDKLPTAKQPVSSDPPPTPILVPARKVSSAKPPVPLRTIRHATYWDRPPPSATKEAKEAAKEDRQQPTTTKEASVTEQTKKITEVSVAEQTNNKKTTSDTSAKAMIEADGYKQVRALVKGADGLWHGRAMRGSVEIAIAVDANGSVMAQ